jgi:hypothetical protein
VIFDYPSATSAALFHSIARRALRGVGVKSETYRVFTKGSIAAALEQSGFRIRSVHRQFVLPIQVHRAIGSRRVTLFIEDKLERLGLLRLFGSPVTVCAERR